MNDTIVFGSGTKKDILSLLEAPPKDYTPFPFWFLNDDLDHDEIRRQLKDFAAHGVYGAVLHPRIGLPDRIPYLSETFFSYIGTALEEMKRLGMYAVLYDEGMYPSGSAGGLAVRENPEYASRGLWLTESPLASDHVLCETEHGFLVERFSGGNIRGTHFGEDDGEPNAPPSADILNPEAVQCFIRLTHEQYYKRFAGYFGNTVVGFFTDEPSILGRNVHGLMPWSRGFDQVFRAAGGALPGLDGLFTGEENEDTALYRKEILKRESEVYYASLFKWCESHGIALMGHPAESDDIETERFFHIPGQDLVFRMVAPEKGDLSGRNSTLGKCSADAARLMHRKRNSNECFGACSREDNPWYLTGGDVKWMTDYLAVRGVNLLIPHAFYYSLRGQRSGERPPDVGPGSIWWPHYQKWSAYMTRVSCLMGETELQTSVAVPCRHEDLKPEEVAELYKTQRSFQYLPESVWAQCEEKDGVLYLDGKSWKTVLAPADQWPSVSHDFMAAEPDCLCEPFCPMLRVAHCRQGERELWFLVNAGNETLNARITLKTEKPLAAWDLWRNKKWRIETEKGAWPLILPPRESLLVFACASDQAWAALPMAQKEVLLSDELPFTLAQDDPAEIRKVYSAQFGRSEHDLRLIAEGEEMAELYVNGRLSDVSFWSPHRLEIPAALLTEEKNILRLEMKGSLANRYGTKPVSYGLDSARFAALDPHRKR